jgi:hypothetical protein
MLSDEAGLAFLQAFAYATKERNTANAAKTVTTDTEDRNLPKQQEYAELLQFRAWRAFNRAIDSISSVDSDV